MGHNPEAEGGGLLGVDPAVNPLYLDRWKRNVQAIVDGCPSATIVVCTTLYSTVAEPYRAAVTAAQIAFVAGLGARVHLCDTAAVYDPTIHGYDGIHPNNLGAGVLAAAMFAVLDPLVETVTRAALLAQTAASGDFGANLDPDYLFAGTGGALAGTVLPVAGSPNGGYASGQKITNNLVNGSGVAVTVTKDAADDGTYRTQIVTVAGTPSAANTIAQADGANLALTGGTPGTFFEALLEVIVDDGAGGAPVGFRGWGLLLGSLGSVGNSGSLANQSSDRPTKLDAVIRMPAKPCFGSATASVNRAFTTRWSAVALTGRIRISRSIIRQTELTAYAAPAHLGSDGIMGANYGLRITGTATVGATLRGDPGCWSGGGLSFAPQWYRDGVAIDGATGWTWVGSVTLIPGDALEILITLGERRFGAVLTDPPYSSGGNVRDKAMATSAKYLDSTSRGKYPEFQGDTRDQRSFLSWSALWMGRARDLVVPGGIMATFTDWRQLPVTTDAIQCAGWVWRGVVPWDKTEASRPQRGRYRNQTEFVAWATNGPRRLEGTVAPGVFRMPVPHQKHHIAGKPVGLMAGLLAPMEGPILDPFMGSATVGIACLEKGVEYVGIEVDEAYFEIACKRLQKALGAA
jgi:site-specific DNA-methyltransferase (adenine-specific)